MRITSFNNKYTAQEFQRAAFEALKRVADDYGVHVEDGRWTYGYDSLDMRFTAKTLDASGAPAKDPLFVQMLSYHGLDDAIVSRDGYKLIGYNPRAPKYPWKVQVVRTGEVRRGPMSWVKARFTASGTAAKPIAAMSTHPTPSTRYDAEF